MLFCFPYSVKSGELRIYYKACRTCCSLLIRHQVDFQLRAKWLPGLPVLNMVLPENRMVVVNISHRLLYRCAWMMVMLIVVSRKLKYIRASLAAATPYNNTLHPGYHP